MHMISEHEELRTAARRAPATHTTLALYFALGRHQLRSIWGRYGADPELMRGGCGADFEVDVGSIWGRSEVDPLSGPDGLKKWGVMP